MAEALVSLLVEQLVEILSSHLLGEVSEFENINLTAHLTTCGHGNTILHIAAKYDRDRGSKKVSQILLLNPLLVFQTNMKGDTPLHTAARSGNTDTANLLIDVTGDRSQSFIRTRNAENDTALHEAVKCGHYNVASLLIQKDASLASLENGSGESPLFLAVDGGHILIAYLILDTFPTCSVFGSRGLTAMHAAVIRSSDFNKSIHTMYQCVRRLLKAVSMSDLMRGFLDELLRRCGPEILEIADKNGWMPHHYAAAMGKSGILTKFLETNRSLAYIKDNEGMSALHISARNGKKNAITSLLKVCPDVCELLDKENRTALHIAVLHRQATVIRSFLRTTAFADLINEQDKDGNTALHLAAISEHCKIIILLVRDSRSNKRLLNSMGLSAFDIINKSNVQLGHIEKLMIRVNTVDKNGLLSSLLESVSREAKTAQPDRTIKMPNTTQTSSPQAASSMEHVALVKEKGKAKDQMADINLLVATIIASITFTAAITMPGGYNSSTGLAILRNSTNFRRFLLFDSLAFGCAAGTMFIHFVVTIISKLRGKAYKYPIQFTMIITIVSLTSTVLAFIMGTSAVMYEDKLHTNSSHDHEFKVFGRAGNVAFFTFLGTLVYIFGPLIVAYLYYIISGAVKW